MSALGTENRNRRLPMTKLRKLPNYQISLCFLKLFLFNALADYHSQITAGGVDYHSQALCRRIQQEQQLGGKLFLRRNGGQRIDFLDGDDATLDYSSLKSELRIILGVLRKN